MYDVDHLTQHELQILFLAPLPLFVLDYEVDGTFWYQEIAQGLFKFEGCQQWLMQIALSSPEDLLRVRAVLFALGESKTDLHSVKRFLESYLKDERDLVVMEAIESIGHLGFEGLLQIVESRLDASTPYSYGAYLRLVSKFRGQAAAPLLCDALDLDNEIIVMSAIDEIDALRIEHCIQKVDRLRQHRSEFVRQAANTAMNTKSL